MVKPSFVDADAQRVLPHSLEAERAALGAVLAWPETWPIVASVLRPDDFFRDAHRRIYLAVGRLMHQAVGLDFLTLREELRRTGELEEVGGPSYLAALTEGIPRKLNVEHYAAIVREKARLRAAIAVGNDLIGAAYDGEQAAVLLAERATWALTTEVVGQAGLMGTAQEVIDDYVASLTGGTVGEPTLTGYADLDGLVGGLKPEDLVIVAGRPSTGKTSLMLGAAVHVAAAGRQSVFFSLEMGRRALAARLIGWRTRVPSARYDRQEASSADYVKLSEAQAAVPIPLRIETASRTVTEIGGWCERAKQDAESPLALVVIDYIQLLMSERRRNSDEAEMADISHALKALAKRLGVPLVALSQLNRAPETRRDKRPTMADLRGSGALEQDCDLGLLLFREEMYKATDENHGIAEVIVAKHRNGPTGVVRLAFLAELAQFQNLAMF